MHLQAPQWHPAAAGRQVRARTAGPASQRVILTKTRAYPLFEKLGGHDAVNAAVTKFYEKVLADDRVKYYFKDTDMAKQHHHQAAFMAYAFGGPNKYHGKDMASAHKNLMPHLEEVHFNAIVENFVATLTEMGVPQDDIDAAIKVVASTKADVLGLNVLA